MTCDNSGSGVIIKYTEAVPSAGQIARVHRVSACTMHSFAYSALSKSAYPSYMLSKGVVHRSPSFDVRIPHGITKMHNTIIKNARSDNSLSFTRKSALKRRAEFFSQRNHDDREERQTE